MVYTTWSGVTADTRAFVTRLIPSCKNLSSANLEILSEYYVGYIRIQVGKRSEELQDTHSVQDMTSALDDTDRDFFAAHFRVLYSLERKGS